MDDWGAGYNVELGYTHGFYRETAPGWLDCLAALKGVAVSSGRRFLELGCGYGYSLILFAGLYPDYEFVGVDFNPAHIAYAKRLAVEAGLGNVRFEEADFVDLATEWPSHWGQFDYVVAHGIISWVAPEIRHSIMRILDRAATPGALVYLSYNSMPGRVTTAPMQHLLRLWQKSEAQDSAKAISTGMERLAALGEMETGMQRALPLFAKTAEEMRGKDPNYLVHEFLNDAWTPFWFDEVAREASSCKLSYVGTANIAGTYLQKVLPQSHRDMLAKYTDPVVREVMSDVLLNRAFRKDVFVRGLDKLSSSAQRDALLDTTFVRKAPMDTAEFKFKLGGQEVKGKEEVYKPLLEAMASGPVTLRALLQTRPEPAEAFQSVLQAMVFLLDAGYVDLARPAANKKPAKALNKALIQRIAEGAPYSSLIAAEFGGVMTTSLPDVIMAQGVQQKTKDAKGLAKFLVERLTQLGKGLVRDGEKLRDKAAMMPYAETLAETFLTTTLPSWKKIGIL